MTRVAWLLAACVLVVGRAQAQVQPGLAPLVAQTGAAPPAPWRVVTLPASKGIPPTRFSTAWHEGEAALQVRADNSYANLVHPVSGGPARALRWRWRLERGLAAADLRSKEGDDVALKVCILFDMPLAAVPLGERTGLRLARALSGEPLPSATLCYVWDNQLPPGTLVPNAYSARVRYLVLDSGPPRPGWQAHERDIGADFLRAFGQESREVPALTAVAVGADADNSHGRSEGWVAGLELVR